MSLISGFRLPASSAFVASVDLARLAQLTGMLGISLQAGQELTDLSAGLSQCFPDGFVHLGLEPDHHDLLEQIRKGESVDLGLVLPALEALGIHASHSAVPVPQAPLDTAPTVRLTSPRRRSMTPLGIASSNIIKPPMGGAVVRTSEGLILFGAPMWFNKWNLQRYWRAGGPHLPPERVKHEIVTYAVHDSEHAGPDVGLLPHEFNSYQSFVVSGLTFTIVAEDGPQAERLKAYFDDAYLGRLTNLTERVRAEYPEGAIGVPDLMAEMTRGFASPHPETLRKIESFTTEGEAKIGQNVLVRRLGDQRYEIFDGGALLGTLDLKKYPAHRLRRQPSPLSAKRAPEVRRMALEEGRAGLWPIGTSDGFDPHGSTSGVMIWNGGRFVLVDPPSQTLEYLADNGIPLDRLEGVIVTHGHSDHYADAIPRLVRSRPDLKLYTTPTIYDLLLDQYRLALGRDDLSRWNLVPVRPQTDTDINGMTFNFDYTFHTVPTIGFDVWREGEILLYFSGDTYADLEAIERLIESAPAGQEPLLGLGRIFQIMRHGLYLYLGSLQDLPPAILMEGGMPPIHTPPSATRALLREAKKDGIDVSRFFVYHLSNKKARREGVPKLKEGAEGWIDLTPPSGPA